MEGDLGSHLELVLNFLDSQQKQNAVLKHEGSTPIFRSFSDATVSDIATGRVALCPLCLNGNTRHQGNAVIESESLRRTALASGLPKRVADSGSDTAPRAQAVCAYVGEAGYIPVPLQTDFTTGWVFVLDNLNVHCSVTLQDPKDRFNKTFAKWFQWNYTGHHVPKTRSNTWRKLKTAANTD
jgi:hypothetical protein